MPWAKRGESWESRAEMKPNAKRIKSFLFTMQAPLFTAINPRFVETPNDYTYVAGLASKIGKVNLYP